ncbi:acyl-CoA dehydrogenase family protein [Conexibacter sp. JD483]|uniref:acyl-CoA dehydrogenase family protein n=1 Tax=unclassified Conexibacter TaxID=2627773 RepID=UPI002726016F|nr:MULTISPECIES: acyl-CoA dehydrogenase family protein [unclassified Conexibacter]MDO8186526.1 acyl-CoA dehydrogenase family protein [Conexibacter sp. CPCC 205706]MDO8200095.1 acyl-CoA dehydrogenase family protein [Conexibacter sp. CPCC 205762]MDR9372193.1 acyl-CoA dehydrogenase family protein [Conexibacter sp. JD483]
MSQPDHQTNDGAGAGSDAARSAAAPSAAPAAAILGDPRLDQALARIAERAPEHDRDGSFPHEAFDALHALGVTALRVPAAYGGGAADLPTLVRVLERVGAADPSVGLVLVWQYVFHADLSLAGSRWPAAVRERVLRSAVEEGALINALRVEPQLGTPARGGLPDTVGREIGDGWELRGHKTYCTGIPALRWLLVWGRTDEEEPRVGQFLVETPADGYRVEQTWDHIGLRASRSDDVIFERVVLPASHAVDIRPPADWNEPAAVASRGRAALFIAANYLGVALAARDWLTRYLNERTPTNLGRPLATLPRFQEAVGEIETLLETARLLVRDAASSLESGGDASRALLAKHVATTNAIAAIEQGLKLTGNPGLTRRNPLERHHRDALTGRVHTPQSDTILTQLGAAALRRAAASAGGGAGSGR